MGMYVAKRKGEARATAGLLIAIRGQIDVRKGGREGDLVCISVDNSFF